MRPVDVSTLEGGTLEDGPLFLVSEHGGFALPTMGRSAHRFSSSRRSCGCHARVAATGRACGCHDASDARGQPHARVVLRLRRPCCFHARVVVHLRRQCGFHARMVAPGRACGCPDARVVATRAWYPRDPRVVAMKRAWLPWGNVPLRQELLNSLVG